MSHQNPSTLLRMANQTSLFGNQTSLPINDYYHSLDPLLVRFLERLKAKPIKYTEGSFSFEIQPGVYSACLDTLEQDDKEVWEHDLISDRFLTVKMPKFIHDSLLVQVHDSIRDQTKHLIESSEESTKKLLQSIRSCLSTTIQVKDGFRCPDESYGVKFIRIPGVIVEISFSQTLQELSEKAQSYLLDSKGVGVQVVIGLKISYPNANKLSIHVWRLRVEKEGDSISHELCKEVEDEILDDDGIFSGRYAFKLKDFAPVNRLALEYPKANLEKEVILEYSDLARYYQGAKLEHEQFEREGRGGFETRE